MSQISDFILKQVSSSVSGVEIPSNIKSQVLSGLSDSILGSLTQTAAKSGGVEQIKSLLTGATSAASSPVTKLAGNLFSSNVVKNLGLDSKLSSKLSSLIPSVLGNLSGIIKDRDGDGDVDLNDIILSLKGGNSNGGSILGAATSILSGILKK